MRLIPLVFLVFPLSGCVFGSLSELKSLNPQASDFNTSLAAEYLAYAESEAELGHGLIADSLAYKGKMALKGETVEPKIPGDGVNRETAATLNAARASLMPLLTEDARRVVPQTAARAQLLYDCWVTQASHNDQLPAPCADEFQAALIELQKVTTSLVMGREETKTLSFAPKSSRLSEESLDSIDGIVEYVQGLSNYAIQLDGRADSASARRLLEKRATTIRKAFAGRGIDASRIQTSGGDTSKEVYIDREDSTDRNQVKITVALGMYANPREAGK